MAEVMAGATGGWRPKKNVDIYDKVKRGHLLKWQEDQVNNR